MKAASCSVSDNNPAVQIFLLGRGLAESVSGQSLEEDLKGVGLLRNNAFLAAVRDLDNFAALRGVLVVLHIWNLFVPNTLKT